MDPDKQPFTVFRNAITTVQVTGEGGAYLIMSALGPALVTKPIKEAAIGSACECGHPVLKGFVKRAGQALHETDANIDADTFLHLHILGIMLLEFSQ